MTGSKQMTPPFIWPAPVVQGDTLTLDSSVSPRSLFDSAETVLGITQGLTPTGAQFLQDRAEGRKDLKCRLVIALYPACPTTAGVLATLENLQALSNGQWEFRLLHVDGWRSAPANITCWVTGQDGTVSIGPTPDFGGTPPAVGQVNMVFHTHAVLLERWRQWFDQVWYRAVPLDETTVAIPPLVPVPGTEEAARLWREYVHLCKVRVQPEVKVKVDPATRATVAVAPSGKETPTPSQLLKLPTLDSLTERVASIYELGDLVAVDKQSRVPPLDVPAKAAWFDVESTRQAGAVKREIRFRISALEPRILQDIENKRTNVNPLLARFSYPLGDSLRWMPTGAYDLFCTELARVNHEGIALLKGVVVGEPDKFVTRQRERIERDANLIYQEFHPGHRISQNAINAIMRELADRLAKALGERLLPQVTRSGVQFHPSPSSDWVSVWGQPLTLLRAIAEFPRKCFTDGYFLRGVKTNRDTLLAAMDVCHDELLRHRDSGRAEAELGFIARVGQSSLDSRAKCQFLLDLIDGTPFSELEKRLVTPG